MSLKKIHSIDLIEICTTNHVQIRTRSAIVEDGKELSATFHRHVIAPGDDYSKEDPRVQAICAAIHTPKVVAA